MKGNYHSVAQREPLSNEPRTTLPENNKRPSLEKIGTASPLQSSPSTVKYGAGTSSGEFQVIGTPLKLNKTPISGYVSADTPMSDRNLAQKKNF